MERIRVIDSHTAGEPTRVVFDGFPDLGNGSVSDRLEIFRTRFDHLRSGIVNEPRGHAAIVGALYCRPSDERCAAGVIFFNNVGFLGMCGHGLIGLIKTLEFTGQITFGRHKVETPVGVVEAELDIDGNVTITNVPSYRLRKGVEVHVEDYGRVKGDVAWGGNWFFLVEEHGQKINLANLAELTRFSAAIRDALTGAGITGDDGREIDHIELFSPSPTADSRNFVLCPGIEYDRSPCGTGTSAKMACLYEDGKLREGETWKQESILGTLFEGSVNIVDGKIVPQIKGTAFITAESSLIFRDDDYFRFGIS